ncbi:Bacitracin export ATP-binding protein BceA [compost metagenome]
MTAKENITLPIFLDRRKVDEEYLQELLLVLGLQDRQQHLPNELSGGQQQRVSIGRSLIARPSIILADEPTGNLDSKSRGEIINLLKICNKKYGQTIIMITHDHVLAQEASRVITIEDGRIIVDEQVNM